MATLLLLLAACTDGSVGLDSKPTDTLPDLGDPFVGVYASASPGSLRSDCVIDVDLFEADGDTVVATAQMRASGGEWTGTVLPGEVLYRAVASWASCTTGPSGAGELASSNFSGVKGDFFLFRYNGVTAAFDVVVQREDFDGGEIEVTFEEGTTLDYVTALAESHGVEADLLEGESETYRVTWDDPTAVGKVLGWFSADDAYVSGSPSWIRPPDWW